MKEEKSAGWFHSNKQHIISLPPSISRGQGVFVSLGMFTILMLSCFWFLLPPYQSDLVILGPNTVDYNSESDTVGKILAAPTIVNYSSDSDTVDKIQAEPPISNIVNYSSESNTVDTIQTNPVVSNVIDYSSDSDTINTTEADPTVDMIQANPTVSDAVNKTQADPPVYNTVQTDPTTSFGLCDLSQGEWVPDSSPPLYTNDTCKYINPFRNCLKNGRPDRGYLHWRWKPSDCELPPFNALHFLELLRGKKIVFIGDSLAQDHTHALICALAQVEDPIEEDYRWIFPSYNFTLANLWSPFLVHHAMEQDELFKLQLDIPEAAWTSQLQEYDIAIISTGYWYFRKSLYHVNNTILGANADAGLNVTTVHMLSAIRITMGNVLRYLATEYQGITMLRTVVVDHFEHGPWNAGGLCNRTVPYAPPRALPWTNNEINKIQVEEFEKAMALVNGSSKLKLLNITYSMSLRPDGHPGLYRNRQEDEPPNDCLHWCVPGPVDMWNQLVLHTLQPIFVKSEPAIKS